jgi:hypothetical protein
VGDFGTALAHRAAWKAVIDGPHDWVLILEDDTELISNELVTEFPPVATECDFVMLNPITHLLTEPVCLILAAPCAVLVYYRSLS